MPLILSIGAIDEEQFDAELEYIAPKGKEENGAIQFEIKADVKLKENSFIRAGYSANADIVLDRKDSVMVIPKALSNLRRKVIQPMWRLKRNPRYLKSVISKQDFQMVST